MGETSSHAARCAGQRGMVASRPVAASDRSPRVARAGALAAAALGVAAASSTRVGRRLDARGFGYANRHRSPALDALLSGITELGSIYASAGAAAALALAGRRRPAARALVAAGGMWLLGQVLKKVVFRPRPYDARPEIEGLRLLIDRPRGSSWPSSHPAVLVAFSATAADLLELRRGAWIGIGALAGAVAASRVGLGVHYPSDVVGGLLLGRAVSLLASPDAGGSPTRAVVTLRP
jgi:membrane-associated phospholipid phosphatase